MEERVVTSQTTGKKYRAIPNMEQVLSGRNSCFGCVFNRTGTRLSSECTEYLTSLGIPPSSATQCGYVGLSAEDQIIWVEVEDEAKV